MSNNYDIAQNASRSSAASAQTSAQASRRAVDAALEASISASIAAVKAAEATAVVISDADEAMDIAIRLDGSLVDIALEELYVSRASSDAIITALDSDHDSDFATRQDNKTGRYVPPSGDLTGLTDRLAMQAAIDEAGGAWLGSGDYYSDFPVQLKSNTFVVGRGRGITRVHSTSTVMAGVLFLTGNFHPGYWPVTMTTADNEHPRYTYDNLNVPADMATVVTRTQTTQDIAVGDLVAVKTDAPNPAGGYAFGHIRRVTAIDGNDITLHKPLNGITGATLAIITKGDSATHPATPSTGPQIWLESYLCEKTLIQGLSVETTNSWTSRAGCLEGTFRDIDCIDVHALIFGNGATECLYENITGNFRARAIEITDGGRDNTYRRIRGVCTGGADYLMGEPLLKLGMRGSLQDFHLLDLPGRRGAWLHLAGSNGTSVQHGYIRGDVPVDNAVPVVVSQAKVGITQCSGVRVSDITFDIIGVMSQNLIKMDTSSDANVRNIVVLNPGGKAASTYTVRTYATMTTSSVNTVLDSTGSDFAAGEFASCKLLNLSWRPPTAGRLVPGATINYSANDQETTITSSNAGAATFNISLNTAWSIGTSVRLYKSVSGTLTVTVADGAVLVVDPAITLPVAVHSRLVVTKIDATTYLVHR